MIERLLLATLLLLAGCAVGPDYVRPAIDTPTNYKEIAGNWKPAAPNDEAPRGAWWEVYGDPQLNELVAQVAVSNLNVRAAEAQYRQAKALLDASQSSFFPAVGSKLSQSRGELSPGAAISKTDQLSLSASWEIDVWGRLRRNAESSEASANASAADLQAALLSAQAALVQTYVQLRVNDHQRRLLERNVAGYRRALEMTQNRYAAGVSGRVDVAQAETQLKSTEAQAIDLKIQRGQLEHALALLIGKAPADFQLAPAETLPNLPEIPVGLPSALLERRPDIAAAERRAAAANAQIGVAQAAFFPALTLSGSGGYQGSGFANLLTLPHRFWSLGPALALTLFDAGARSAQKEQYTAAYDKAVALYRQTVLTGFQEVEDNLVALRYLKDEHDMQQAASASAAESLRLVENQYRAGMVGYQNVVIAQATALNAERTTTDISGRRLLASVALQKALGGGWKGEAAKP